MFIQCLTQGYKLGEKTCNTDLNLNKNCIKFKTFFKEKNAQLIFPSVLH